MAVNIPRTAPFCEAGCTKTGTGIRRLDRHDYGYRFAVRRPEHVGGDGHAVNDRRLLIPALKELESKTEEVGKQMVGHIGT